ncbi:MAG: metallophosphoesterase [Acidobacteriota bacterium]|nr:metallophosphoesterase [Acidobacteriota bacterium]
MGQIKQFRDPKLSLWQSAVEEVVARKTAGAQTLSIGAAPVISGRPDPDQFMMKDSAAYCTAVDSGAPIPQTAPGAAATEGLIETLGYCSLSALKLAKAIIGGQQQDKDRLKADFQKFGGCNPGYVEAAIKYAEYFIAGGKKIPYRGYTDLGQYVIDGKLPAGATIAILGDWGTGEQPAKTLLKQIADKNPDVVFHLGDVYYSGTEFEDSNYFYNPWTQILNLASRPIPTFTLSGNHDMYCGGVPYYNLIDKLGQPASYFCLRNDNWQFLAMDTGLHDANPSSAGQGATFLEDSEVAWLKDKIDNAGARRTVLLSHHQLFSAFEPIDGNKANLRLYPQVSAFLPKTALWLWGHEHSFVVYGPFMNLKRGRCIGHAGFPVAAGPMNAKFPDVPLITKDAGGNPIALGATSGLFNHGYAMMKLDGAAATVAYYQDSDPVHPMFVESID